MSNGVLLDFKQRNGMASSEDEKDYGFYTKKGWEGDKIPNFIIRMCI